MQTTIQLTIIYTTNNKRHVVLFKYINSVNNQDSLYCRIFEMSQINDYIQLKIT